MKATVRLFLALLLGVVYAWFALSLAWSADEMTVCEKAAGVAYGCLVTPLYIGAKRVFRLG